MSFINDQVSPVESHKVSALGVDNLVCGNHCIKLAVDDLGSVQMRAFFCISVKTNYAHHRAPLDEFFHPVVDGALGNNDQKGAIEFSELFQVRHHGDALNCLSETHLVC